MQPFIYEYWRSIIVQKRSTNNKNNDYILCNISCTCKRNWKIIDDTISLAFSEFIKCRTVHLVDNRRLFMANLHGCQIKEGCFWKKRLSLLVFVYKTCAVNDVLILTARREQTKQCFQIFQKQQSILSHNTSNIIKFNNINKLECMTKFDSSANKIQVCIQSTRNSKENDVNSRFGSNAKCV